LQLLEIYDYTSGLLRIGPFHYEPLRSASILLQESDEFILRHLTTSPDVEPPHVVGQVSISKGSFKCECSFDDENIIISSMYVVVR
jgi:hypothetical protein